MPLDFRTAEVDEGFTIKRFLKTFGLGIGIFLAFMALGYYVLGPRIQVSEEGRIRFVISDSKSNDAELTEPTEVSAGNPEKTPLPKVEVYERLPRDIVSGTGVIIGSREVAPFNYEEYQRRKAERKPKQQELKQEETFAPSDEDYFIPDESEPVAEPQEPTDSPDRSPSTVPEPSPPTPAPAPEPSPPAPAPEPTTNPDPAPQPPSDNASGGLFRVQIGVYESRENANNVAQAVRASGFEATIVPFQRDGRTLYRVQSLVTRNRAKAEQLKQRLESLGFPAVIVSAN